MLLRLGQFLGGLLFSIVAVMLCITGGVALHDMITMGGGPLYKPLGTILLAIASLVAAIYMFVAAAKRR